MINVEKLTPFYDFIGSLNPNRKIDFDGSLASETFNAKTKRHKIFKTVDWAFGVEVQAEFQSSIFSQLENWTFQATALLRFKMLSIVGKLPNKKGEFIVAHYNE
jgi:hypothetical protein